MFEGFDVSNITVGLAAVGLAFWVMKYFIPSERKAYRDLLKDDRESWTAEREANQRHVNEILEGTKTEQKLVRQERADERISLGKIMTQVLVALAKSGEEAHVNHGER